MFGSSRLEDEDRQEDFGLFRSCVKIDSVDMLKFTHTHTSSICFVFGLTGFGFQIYIYNLISFVINKKVEIVGPKAFHPSFDDD